MIIRNGTVLHVNRLERGADVRIDGPTIVEIGVGIRAQDEHTLDATGCYVLPGFIDLHTHGLRHVYVQEGGWREYAALQLEQGVTGCLPTLFGPPAVVAEAMRRGRAETADLLEAPNLLGFRLEMPYLAKPGAGQTSDLVAITDDATAAMWEASGGKVRLWDVSPELPGALSVHPLGRGARHHHQHGAHARHLAGARARRSMPVYRLSPTSTTHSTCLRRPTAACSRPA